ncbi:hypothetical protein SNE40_007520 [Patella caerulea]|uniref:G-protein coupled receptors family 1 profile domain-containing protein n=1 Tax=Patella caerulea TaxID=87958 RepID=A0AAN8Q2G0_PATCE
MAFNTTLNSLETLGSSVTTMNDSQENSTDDQYSNDNNVPGSGGFITQITADVIRSAINCYLLPPIVLLGMVGNIMSLIILGGKKMRQYSTNIVLAYLAFIDTLLLLIAFMRKMPCLVGKADPLTAQTIDYIMLTAPLILELITSRTSSLLSLVICCERFIAVFKPLKVKLWVTPKRMIFSVVSVTVIVIGLLAVDFGLATVSLYYDNTKNRTMARITYQPIYLKNQKFFDFYNSVFLAITLRVLPMILITILTIAIITQIRRRKKWLKDVMHATSNPNTENDMQAMTKMLMTIVSIYIVCLLPGSIFITLTLIDKRFSLRGQFQNEFRVVSSISAFLEVFNSSANFVVYIGMNKKFSNILVQMICGFRKINRRHNQGVIESNVTISSTLG